MKNENEVSSLRIILMGQVIVNLPVIVIIILSIILASQLGMGWSLSFIIGSGVGWFFWSRLLDKWKVWALNQNVDRERIYRLGKWGLINFYRYRIFDQVEEDI